MAQKSGSGKMKRFLLVVFFIIFLAAAFIIMGGGGWLKSTGVWLGRVGTKAEDVKQNIERKATTIEKTVEKLKEGDRTGGNK
jgi:hypothetical protein